MAETSKSKDSSKGKTFDVSHPGKSAPSATSRPVIISHGPIMRDPMMQSATDNDAKDDKPSDKASGAADDKPRKMTHKKVIAAPESLKANEENEADARPEEEKPKAASDSPGSNEEAVVDSVAEQAANSKQQQEAEKKAAEQAAHVAELVQKKDYFVPINVAKRQRSSRVMMMVLGLLLVAGFALGVVYLTSSL